MKRDIKTQTHGEIRNEGETTSQREMKAWMECRYRETSPGPPVMCKDTVYGIQV